MEDTGYSSLRAKEATQALETAGAKAAIADGKQYTAGTCSFWLEVSAEMLKLIQTVWSDKWYLDVVYSKMLQLSLELLARYGKIVETLASNAEAAGNDKAWDATAAAPAWATGSLPARLSRAAADVCLVLDELSWLCGGGIADLVVSKAPDGSNGRPAEIARSLLQEADTGFARC